jgi:hypothetical protein
MYKKLAALLVSLGIAIGFAGAQSPAAYAYTGEVFRAIADPTSPSPRSSNATNYMYVGSGSEYAILADHRADGVYAHNYYDLALPEGQDSISYFGWDRTEAAFLDAWYCFTLAVRTSTSQPWVYYGKIRYNTDYTIIFDTRWDWQVKEYYANGPVCTS